MANYLKKIFFEKNMLSLSSALVAAFLGLVSFMILTRSFDKELFGNWVLYTALASFTDLLRFGLTRNALVRFLSGADEANKKSYLGASYYIGLKLVGILTILLWGSLFALNYFDVKVIGGYLLFLQWYPILALLNLSWNNALSYFQAEQNFKHIFIIRTLNIGIFVLFLGVNQIWFHWGMFEVIIAHLISNLVPTILVIFNKTDGLAFFRNVTKKANKEIFSFGKFSMGTLIGSSLLKSADTFIIGLNPMLGAVGIAQYAIPLKLTDLLGIPLRSFTLTAYPKMSKLSLQNNLEGLKKTFYAYTGAITLLFIPASILTFIFAKPLILILGGNEYLDSLPLLIIIFRIFALYSILLPIDRFIGIALDSINKPKLNFYKIIVMASANVIGDLIGVFVFESLEIVALVTVLFTIIGIVTGLFYLKKFINIRLFQIFSEGISFFKNIKNYL